MNSIRPFISSESVRAKKGNSTVARYILRTGKGCQHGLWQASMPCGLVFRLEIIDLAYTYSIITLVSSGRVHTM